MTRTLYSRLCWVVFHICKGLVISETARTTSKYTMESYDFFEYVEYLSGIPLDNICSLLNHCDILWLDGINSLWYLLQKCILILICPLPLNTLLKLICLVDILVSRISRWYGTVKYFSTSNSYTLLQGLILNSTCNAIAARSSYTRI